MARMKSLLITGLVILGLTAVSKPAFAFKPIKVTLTCTASGGDVVTGSFAYLTLCAAADSCSGTTAFDCPTLPSCDSSTTTSESAVCTAPFKVVGFMAAASATDYLVTGGTPATGGFGGGGTIYLLTGKGFTDTIYPDAANNNNTDYVVINVK
jgi:hypothetical protein